MLLTSAAGPLKVMEASGVTAPSRASGGISPAAGVACGAKREPGLPSPGVGWVLAGMAAKVREVVVAGVALEEVVLYTDTGGVGWPMAAATDVLTC